MESPITHWEGLIIVRLFLVAFHDRLHTSATNTLCSLLIVTGLIGVNAQYQPSVIGIPHRFLNTLCKPNPLNRVSTNRSPPTAGVISRYRLNSSRDWSTPGPPIPSIRTSSGYGPHSRTHSQMQIGQRVHDSDIEKHSPTD